MLRRLLSIPRGHRAAAALLAAAALGLAGCAGTPEPVAPPRSLLDDRLFGAPSEPVGTAHVLDVTPQMRRYLALDIAEPLRSKGPQNGLVDALYRRGQLRLEYDAGRTRTAAEAFEARSGNCLSLVLMTAALARELNLQVHFQSAFLEESWSRSGNLLFASGHVNITLGRRLADIGTRYDQPSVTVDFLPAGDLRRLRTREITETTVLAMYANNRAAEALARDEVDNAYAWTAEALRVDPSFPGAFNTLGVVYLRAGHLQHAERVFDRILAQNPMHTRALANLAETYRRQGREGESGRLRERLAQVESEPPFHWFNLGVAAAQADDWVTARRYFERELKRADDYHEFHFWLAVADWKLGDVRAANEHLQRALEYSVTRDQHRLYAGKLAWLRDNGAAPRTPSGS